MFQFVEKRKEMKAGGRTEKEMEESYCFLFTTSAQVSSGFQLICLRLLLPACETFF